MRKYNEMIAEFSGRNENSKTLWLKELPLEELKIFREGLGSHLNVIQHPLCPPEHHCPKNSQIVLTSLSIY